MQAQLNYTHAPTSRSVVINPPARNFSLPLKMIFSCVGLTAIGSTGANAVSVNPYQLSQTSATMAAGAREEDFNVPTALLQIKDAGGFTWVQVSQLLGVSRRAVADWMKGQGIRSNNEIAIFQLRDRVAQLAHLPKFKIRSAVLGNTQSTTRLRSMLSDPPVFESDATPLAGGPLESEDNTLEILE